MIDSSFSFRNFCSEKPVGLRVGRHVTLWRVALSAEKGAEIQIGDYCYIANSSLLCSERLTIGSEVRTILLVGFLGGFTTFSTFVGETGRLTADAQWFVAGANLLLQNVVGLAVFFLGLAVGRAL